MSISSNVEFCPRPTYLPQRATHFYYLAISKINDILLPLFIYYIFYLSCISISSLYRKLLFTPRNLTEHLGMTSMTYSESITFIFPHPWHFVQCLAHGNFLIVVLLMFVLFMTVIFRIFNKQMCLHTFKRNVEYTGYIRNFIQLLVSNRDLAPMA